MRVREVGEAPRRRRPLVVALLGCLVAAGLGVWLAPRTYWAGATVSVLGIGAGVAIAAVLARERLGHTVDRADSAEEAAGAPLLADLVAPADLTDLPALEPGTVAATRFDHLRRALERYAATGGQAPVVIAGVAPGEVTVWVGANLAIALAGSGRRVLLIDGRMGERFGRPVEEEPDTAGLSDVLLGVADLSSALSPGPVDLMDVLPAGSVGREPTLDLIVRGFTTVVAEAATDHDHVLVLGPPLRVCDDSRAMAIGGALVLTLVRSEVSAAHLRWHTTRIRDVGTQLLGVVMVSEGEQVAAT